MYSPKLWTFVNNYSSMLLIGPSHVEATFHTLKAQLRLFAKEKHVYKTGPIVAYN